jgi:hypothetical protein
MFSKMSVFVAALATVAIAPVFAEQPLHARIPFDFKAGVTRLQKGEYHVSFPSQSVVLIQTPDHRQSAMLLTSPRSTRTPATDGKLVFNRYGDQLFLSGVWSPGNAMGRELRQSKAEKELARQYAVGQNLVALQSAR